MSKGAEAMLKSRGVENLNSHASRRTFQEFRSIQLPICLTTRKVSFLCLHEWSKSPKCSRFRISTTGNILSAPKNKLTSGSSQSILLGNQRSPIAPVLCRFCLIMRGDYHLSWRLLTDSRQRCTQIHPPLPMRQTSKPWKA